MRLFIVLFVFVASAWGQASHPLRLEKTVELPDVQGRIDHLSADVKGGRLFVSALGNNTVEVIDTKAGKRVKTIGGLQEWSTCRACARSTLRTGVKKRLASWICKA